MRSRPLLVLTTCANPTEADELAAALVEGRLAACVNRVEGVVSTYRWESKLERDKETLLLIKTTEGCFDELEGVLHPGMDTNSIRYFVGLERSTKPYR